MSKLADTARRKVLRAKLARESAWHELSTALELLDPFSGAPLEGALFEALAIIRRQVRNEKLVPEDLRELFGWLSELEEGE